MKRSILPEWLETKEQQETFIKKNCGYLRSKESHRWYVIEDEKAIEKYVFDVLMPFLADHGLILKKVRIKEENRESYIKDGRYLPTFMQDFHDQKDFFKYLGSQPNTGVDISWMNCHVFVVDFFLWNAMREHGYTLQKSTRKDLGTKDVWSTLANYEHEQQQEKAKFLWGIINQSRKENTQDGK